MKIKDKQYRRQVEYLIRNWMKCISSWTLPKTRREKKKIKNSLRKLLSEYRIEFDKFDRYYGFGRDGQWVSLIADEHIPIFSPNEKFKGSKTSYFKEGLNPSNTTKK